MDHVPFYIFRNVPGTRAARVRLPMRAETGEVLDE